MKRHANLSEEKTKELLVYVAYRLSEMANSGAILVNKALYFIDNVSFLKRGKPISNFTYVKQKLGPTPEPGKFLSIREQLIGEHVLESQEIEYFGRIQKKLIAKRKPNFDVFEKDEILIIDQMINEVCKFNGTQISDITHQYPSWQVAEPLEEIPFYTFLLSSKTPSKKSINWAKKEMQDVSNCKV